MPRSIATATLTEMQKHTTGEAFWLLAEVSRLGFPDKFYVNDTQNVVSNGQTYNARGLEVRFPVDGEDVNYVATLVADNTDRDLVSPFRAIAGERSRPECTVSIIASSDPDTVLASYTMDVQTSRYNDFTFEMELGIENFINEPWPGDVMGPGTFPGLF